MDEASSASANLDSDTKKQSYKEGKEKRLERRNAIKKLKRELGKIEPAIEKLKAKAGELQKELDNSSDEGWTVLADLTEKLQKVNDDIEEKEMEWLETAETLETLEEEESAASTQIFELHYVYLVENSLTDKCNTCVLPS